MSKQNPIVAATDLSAPSRHAAERAALLAQAGGAPLTLVHTVGGSALDDLRRWLADSRDAAGGEQAAGMVEAEARQQLQALAGELGKRHNITVQTQLVTGNAIEQVTRFADEVHARLVVTGTRGAGFFRGVVVGSTAERIATASACPVLMVRQAPHAPYRRVLVPVDFSSWSLATIRLAQRMAPGAMLVLMHAVELPYLGKMRLAGVAEDVLTRYGSSAREEAWTRLRALSAEAGLTDEQAELAVPAEADPWMLIVQQEQDQDCDLIVIGRQGRNALGDMLLGSTTRMVLAEGMADVLVCSKRAE